MKRQLIAFLIGLSVSPAFADEPLPQALAPEQETFALRDAERIGRAMCLHDRAAVVATDTLLANTAVKPEVITMPRVRHAHGATQPMSTHPMRTPR